MTTDILRVRAGPGYEYEILGRLPTNHVIDILARTSDSAWLQIAYPNSTEHARTWACPAFCAWVAAEFVTPQTGFDTLPVAAPLLPPVTLTPQPSATATVSLSVIAQPDDIPYDLLPPWY
jgi:hypothetical protein